MNNECSSPPSTISSTPQNSLLTTFQQNFTRETRKVDNILCNLRQYYAEAKMKRQLGYEVPAGFRQLTTTQRLFTNKLSPTHQLPDDTNDSLASHLRLLSENQSSSTDIVQD